MSRPWMRSSTYSIGPLSLYWHIAQLVEQLAVNQWVGSSSLSVPATIVKLIEDPCNSSGQIVINFNTQGCYYILNFNASLAQMEKHHSCKVGTLSSSLRGSSIFYKKLRKNNKKLDKKQKICYNYYRKKKKQFKNNR